jgi:CDP-glucose 4,6-dehydratase
VTKLSLKICGHQAKLLGKIGKSMKNPSPEFWKGKHVLLTGHTGFKGAWLSLVLNHLGAKVTGISLPPNSNPNLFTLAKISGIANTHFVDIRESDKLSKIINKTNPEIIFHLAAQALVRPSYLDPLQTFSTNIMGTAHVLDSLRKIESVKVAVMVTTDKVYQNLEQIKPYQENDHLGGHDPYSASKAASELIISSYRDSFLLQHEISIASARAGNVIGGGDWSEDRLIPDAIRAWNLNRPLVIRKPKAIRPWQHVLEPLTGYLILAESLYKDKSLIGAYNFGSENTDTASVEQLVRLAQSLYPGSEVVIKNGDTDPHEAGLLLLDTSKAKTMLGVLPRWNLLTAVNYTMKWYQAFSKGDSARNLCENDIDRFINS